MMDHDTKLKSNRMQVHRRIPNTSSRFHRGTMDHLHSYSFPGLVFLLAQLTYRFVPYGHYLLTLALIVVLLSAAVKWISWVFWKHTKLRSQ